MPTPYSSTHVALAGPQDPGRDHVVAQGRVRAGKDAREHWGSSISLAISIGDQGGGEASRPGDDFEPKFLEPEMSWEQLALALELHSMLVTHRIASGFADPRPAMLRRALNPLELEAARWTRFNDPRHSSTARARSRRAARASFRPSRG